MRKKQDSKSIKVDSEVHKMLVKDRDHFQKVIGGGQWSISDTIKEYKRIMGKK